jgi:membrane-bound lytic murein transglycosylase A
LPPTILFVAAIQFGCAATTIKQEPPAAKPESVSCPPSIIVTPTTPQMPEMPVVPNLLQVDWAALPNWGQEDLLPAWGAFLQSCSALRTQATWEKVCAHALNFQQPDNGLVRGFFETNFHPFQVRNPDASDQGLITGYYEPLLRGSRQPSQRYSYPIYGVPKDLLVIDLSEVYPELKNMRLRGRVEGQKVRPYFSRAEIERGNGSLAGHEILWVDDAVELFFLQIQGSGRVILENGEVVRVGYAEQNGYPYRSIGRLLVDRGDLPLERASMQGIQQWAKQNPDKLSELLNYNASYVFFREFPLEMPGPIGSLGVPLTAGRSLAVDTRFITAGAPVFLSTTWPNSQRPLHRLMVAQDTGGAIKGAVRADFFWGFGEDAAKFAGKMKQSGKLWVLLPKEQATNQN